MKIQVGGGEGGGGKCKV